MSKDKNEIIVSAAEEETKTAKIKVIGLGVKNEVDKIRSLLQSKGREDLADIIEGDVDSFAMLHRIDSLAAVSFLASLKELLAMAIEPIPAAMEEALNEDGTSAGEIDPQQLYALSKYKEIKLNAIKQLADIITKRLPTQNQYDPHMWIGGKRFPVPIDPEKWKPLDGEMHFKPTIDLYKRYLEKARNEFDAKLEEMSTFHGRCAASPDGQCVYSGKIPKIDNFNPETRAEEKEVENDDASDENNPTPSFPPDQ